MIYSICSQGWYIGITAASQAVKAGSTPVPCSKKERHPHGCLSFLEQHFCYAKVTACGRVIEREWGNPSKVPPSHSPFLAVGGSADNKTCGQSQKKKHHPSGWCFLFGMSRAGLNLLPRPARSALNQEVRQGSCEWLCHSWDAGSESSLVARSKKERHPCGVSFFFGATLLLRKSGRLRAGD